MTGYDDYQTEEEYIAAWKKSAGGEMDTKELVKRLRKIADASRRADGTDIPLGQDLRAANDVIQRLERERDEALAKLGATARLALSLEVEADERIAVAESELTTLRSRVAKMEEALRAIDAKVVELGLAAQRKANGHKHEKFAAVRHSMRLIVSAALTEEQP